ncbi:Sigma-W factor [Anaerohalosphaera lusitana]|uniref:RNA polymerase sigma factor n=1 Tax=Anaerohalosphaera lusitana TaxID=1936003 RepID=A0A1U9NJB6_9BACT|nr:sigma-70 family RNA polymerase sigma factor [Anaerohalosphaera lusitana]AQT67897.1 Sigma-W factor [Anaerohalosphaera lusitana]
MKNRDSFQKTALIHLTQVYRAAFALSGSHDLAEDLTQTTFAKAYQRYRTFKKGSNCKAWLMTILRNTWIDELRRKKLETCSLDAGEYELPHPVEKEETSWTDSDDLLENFGDEQIISALGQLPDDQRLTIYLTDVEEMSHEEVAQILDVAVGTVKSRTSRARSALRNLLQDYSRTEKSNFAEAENEPPEQRAI